MSEVPGDNLGMARRIVTGPLHDHIIWLRTVEASVATLESSLQSGDLGPGVAAADELVVATTKLLQDLGHQPGYNPTTDAELVAALHVFQNAAFSFRRLAGVTGEPDPDMAVVCADMIEQGRHHYLSVIEASGDQRSQRRDQDNS